MLPLKYVTLHKARKLEAEGTPSAIFVIKTPRYDCCVPNVVYFYDRQMSIVKHFSVHSDESEFGNKEKVQF